LTYSINKTILTYKNQKSFGSTISKTLTGECSMRFSLYKNNFLTVLVLLFIIVFNSALVVAEEPFAPKITLPEKIENRDNWVNLVESWTVPSKEKVGIPAYPGAFIVALMDSGPMEVNDDTIMTLPSITLATEDEQAKVVSFYKEKLKEWKYKNSFDMFDIFWDGPDEFNNMDMTQGMTIPNLVVFGSTDGEPNFMPEAKTAITIVYKPKK
jgi:hypothetical protein